MDLYLLKHIVAKQNVYYIKSRANILTRVQSKAYTELYEGALCARERAHMRAACLLQTRALSSIIQVYKSNYL